VGRLSDSIFKPRKKNRAFENELISLLERLLEGTNRKKNRQEFACDVFITYSVGYGPLVGIIILLWPSEEVMDVKWVLEVAEEICTSEMNFCLVPNFVSPVQTWAEGEINN
jgi:hypothetical protein